MKTFQARFLLMPNKYEAFTYEGLEMTEAQRIEAVEAELDGFAI